MEILDQAAHELLNDLVDLPQKLLDPHWLERFEQTEEEHESKNRKGDDKGRRSRDDSQASGV
jgi:hypothetical protein